MTRANIAHTRAQTARIAALNGRLWGDRLYQAIGLAAGLCALGWVGFSLFDDFASGARSRERMGWDLKPPPVFPFHQIGE